MKDRIDKSDEDWRKQLTAEQFEVTRRKGTEKAFTGKYYHCKDAGIYQCICCGNDLFVSDTQYESGTGWPSFWVPIAPDHIETEQDHSFFIQRTEVRCGRCGAHLGHVFDDGPTPTHLRYCINSVALNLIKKD